MRIVHPNMTISIAEIEVAPVEFVEKTRSRTSGVTQINVHLPNSTQNIPDRTAVPLIVTGTSGESRTSAIIPGAVI